MLISEGLSLSVHARRLAFGGDVLFDDLHLTVPGGQWTCLLGPSGVGKTSLLRVIAGLSRGDQEIAVTCDDGRPLRGRAAYMAQQDLLLPWLSVLENALLGSRLRGEGKMHEPLARELLAEVGLGDRLRDRPAALSGGMRQRAALVRTLVEKRPVVLMDEPFSGLDAITKLELQSLAARMLKGRTVLLVTHDPLEALRLGHQILVLSGRPVRLDPATVPTGITPRDVRDPSVLSLQGDLLDLLTRAKRAEVA